MSMYCKSFAKGLFGFKRGVFKFAHIFFKYAFKARSVPVNIYFHTVLYFLDLCTSHLKIKPFTVLKQKNDLTFYECWKRVKMKHSD